MHSIHKMSSNCNESMTNSLASAWLNIMRLVNSKSPAMRSDGAILAKINLHDTIEQLKMVEESLKEEIRSTASHVKVAQTQNAKTTLQHLLIKSRTKRLRLTQTHKKRLNMEQQLEALAMSELNNQVLTSMQKTSVALKAMGMQNAVENADDVMMDMQETHQDLSALQDALGQQVNPDLISDDNLAEELEMLMSADTDIMLEVPILKNKMGGDAQTDQSSKSSKSLAEPDATPSKTNVASGVQDSTEDTASLQIEMVSMGPSAHVEMNVPDSV
tara:strand:+ start:5291 stop:6109 length:819 start_codon:yes stop_codon:yes gene_type:complete